VERTPDPQKRPLTINGIFSAGPAVENTQGQARGSEFGTTSRVVSMTAEFWLPRREVPKIGRRPKKGDLIELISRPDSPTYAVSQVQESDMGDFNLILVIEDKQ
jgi:hypothetical protein